MKVLVILGGDSSEREISLLSGTNIVQALKKAGYEVSTYDPATGFQALSDALKGIDLVFPMLHGTGGEDGVIQRALELEGVPFIGSGSEVSAACFDKWQTIQNAPLILFPKTELVTRESINNSSLLKTQYVIKPRSEGSSVDTYIVHDPKDFDIGKIDSVFDKHNDELLIEECIRGREITVPVLGDKALPVVEIIPPEGKEFDYTNKYNGATTENCPPKHIGKDLQKRAQNIALELHHTMKCRHYSRTDMIIDNKDDIYVLEINTIPGMTKESLFPKAAAANGIPIHKLMKLMVEMAIN